MPAAQRWAVVAAGAGLAAIAVLLGAAVRQPAGVSAAVSLPDAGPLPAFALTDQAGAPLTLERLRGSVWIASFVFTRCAGQCPLITSRMAGLQRVLAGEPELHLVSFSVDPAHDTPEILAAYARRLGAWDRWHWATGEPGAVASLARAGFRLGVSEDGTAEEPITHSVRLVLVDRAGHVRGSYDSTEDDAMQRLESDARRLLGESGP